MPDPRIKNILSQYDNTPKSSDDGVKSYLQLFEEKADYDAAFENFTQSIIVTPDEATFDGTRRNNDYMNGWENELGPRDLNEVKAQSQSKWTKAGLGVARIAVEAGINILQVPGYVGGALGATFNEIAGDGEGSMDIMVNNWWVDALEGAKEHYNNEIAPIYVKNSVKNGNLWDNISSIDFWSTEGASGLGFLLSAFAPGAAIKGLGVGAKLANALGKSKNIVNGNKILQMADEAAAATGLASTENAINVVGATFANTMFEAGVEADGAIQAYEEKLVGKLNSGEITQEQYLELLPHASGQGAKVFRDNLGILLIPNLIMSKALFGKAVPSKQLGKFKTEGNKILPELQELTRGDKLLKGTKTFGQATASEAFLEEGGQMTSEMYHTDEYINKMVGKDSKSYGETYLDMLGSTEGQKAMFLGSLFGTGATMVGNRRQYKADIEQRNKLAEVMTNGVNFFEASIDGIYKKDENGKIILEDNAPVVDKQKVAELGESVDYIKSIEEAKEQYKLLEALGVPGAAEKAALLDQNIVNNMLFSFVHAGEEGIAVLKNYLENSEGLKTLTENLNSGREVKKTEQQVINDLVKEAEELKKDYDFYTKYGEFTNELYKKEHEVEFYNKYSAMIRNKYASSHASLRFLTDRKNDLTTALDKAERDFIKELPLENVSHLPYSRKNDIITNLTNRINILEDLEKDIEKELDAIADASKQGKAYEKFRKGEAKKVAAEQESKELDDILATIKSSQKVEDIEKVEIPSKFQSGSAAKVIEKTKSDKKKDFLNAKKEQEVATKDSSEKTQEQIDKDIAEQQEKIKYIQDQYGEGEQIPAEGLDLPEGFGNDVSIKEVTDEGFTVQDENGKTHTFDVNSLYTHVYDPESSYSTEGGESEGKAKANIENTSTNYIKVENDARIAITNNSKEGPVEVLFKTKQMQDAYEFETTPSDKTGYYGIGLNPAFSKTATGNIKKAIDAFNVKDFSDIELLVNYYPLTISLSEIAHAPLENKTKGDQTVFNNTTAQLKRTIFKELEQGTKMEDIQIQIKGQYGGVLQIDGNNENNVKDLDFFKGDVKNIKPTDVYIVNDTASLENVNGDVDLNKKRDLAKGEVYIKIKTANGTPFPLKLNVAKISDKEADLLYDLFTLRFADFDGGKLKEFKEGETPVRSSKISELDNDVFTKLQEQFPEVVQLFKDQKIYPEELTIRDVTDFFIWDGTSSPKSRVRFNRGNLQVGTTTYSKEDFLKGKDAFIAQITDMKRRHVKFKRKKADSANLSLQNPKYLEYLINNKVLNTNATVNEPTFQHRTTMYVGTNTIKVNGKLSDFNKDVVHTYRSNLLGSNTSLKKRLPKLFKLGLELNADSTKYVDKHGNEYNRMTALKDAKFTKTKASIAGARRGNVTDLLLRDFFTPFNDIQDLDLFKVKANKYLEQENQGAEDILMIGDNFFEGLHTIFSDYKRIFDSLGYTIFSNVPTIPLDLGKKGMYAGTVDLLAYNNKTKKWIIIDLKTSTLDRRESYEKTNAYDYKRKDLVQQNGYRAAFEQSTGREVESLKILPIKASSDDVNNRFSYLEAIPSKVPGEPFLDVSMDEDIFEILKIKEVEPGKIDINLFKTENRREGDGSELAIDVDEKDKVDLQTDIFEAFLPKKETTKAIPVVPKVTPKKQSVKKVNGLTSEQRAFAGKQLFSKAIGVSIQVNVGDKQFIVTAPVVKNKEITDGLYVFNVQTKNFEFNKDAYLKAVKARNMLIDNSDFIGGTTVSEKTAEKTWNSRFNFVSLPKETNKKVATIKKKVESIDYDAMSEADVIEFTKKLRSNGYMNRGNIKEIMHITKDLKSNINKLKKTIAYLASKGISKEEIIKKCK